MHMRCRNLGDHPLHFGGASRLWCYRSARRRRIEPGRQREEAKDARERKEDVEESIPVNINLLEP